MGSVINLTIAFIAISFLWKKLSEKLAFFRKSNKKYRILDYLADCIHYGEDIGIEASLALDSPVKEILNCRKSGQTYLASRLNPSGKNENVRGARLAAKLVDCRFALAKVCMPLLRELEFPANRNFLTGLKNRGAQSEKNGLMVGMFEVDSETVPNLMFVGNDAVHTLGIQSFHMPIQEEINKRMSLLNGGISSTLRFSPLSLNPELEKNADKILRLTGMDQVSMLDDESLEIWKIIGDFSRFLRAKQVRYSLSGSEAMDAALKDIKASCRNKKVIVRFSSAYHGHVSGVDFLNCGPDHIFLNECSQDSIDFIEKYHYRIAAVVINPMQHFTGINQSSPPGEKLTLSHRIRPSVSRDRYAKWLHDLQDKCNYCTKYLTKVAFVLDDIYFAFRTPEIFSKNYFLHPDTSVPLKPNVLVLGKGVAAGYPLSMVLGEKGYLNTYDKKFLLQVNKTVGTLSAWHGGIVASNVFLDAMTNALPLKSSPQEQLTKMIAKFDKFTTSLNSKFDAKNLPLRIRNFSNTFSIDYLNKSLYNSRYPQYLMAEGVYLGNYSTGKFNLTNDCTEKDLEELGCKFVEAGMKMLKHGFFEPASSVARRKLFCRLVFRFVKNLAWRYYAQIMEDKHIDIEVSHNHPVNKFGHFWSSVFMILVAYPNIFYGETMKGCLWFFLTHVVRQSGHFFYEHQDKDIEKRKFGHKDNSKKKAAVALLIAAISHRHRFQLNDYFRRSCDIIPTIRVDQYVALVALFTIVPHYVEITHQFGFFRGVSWLLKIITDPFTDILDFYTHWAIHPKWFGDFKSHKAVYKLNLETKTVKKVM